MKKIPLTKSRVALVDDEDFEFLNKWKWHALQGQMTIYAAKSAYLSNGKRGYLAMHNLIMLPSCDLRVDHIDGNTFNNQKSNLRHCTAQENSFNKGKNKRNKSGYKGVYWHLKNKRWRASIGFKYEKIYLGEFKTPELAAEAYNQAAMKYHGEFAYQNIIGKE